MLEELQAGLVVTLMGLGVVFVLLTLLVYVVQGMSRLCRAIEGAQTPASSAPAPSAEEEVVSAIGAAVSVYRRRHKRPMAGTGKTEGP